MEQQMGGWNKVISIACTERQLVKTDGHPLHLRLGTVKTGANHPTSGTSLLNVALAESCREGELAIVEGIVIVGGKEGEKLDICPPCGICRQVMAEFCDPEKFQIILAESEEKYETYLLKELLPLSFGGNLL